MLSLAELVTRLATLSGPDPEACARAFGCVMTDEGGRPHQYRAVSPARGLAELELRVGSSGSIVVATIDQSKQEEWARESSRIGRPIIVDVVSPPIHPAAGWVPRWSERRQTGDVVLAFGFEGERESPRLVSVSRSW